MPNHRHQPSRPFSSSSSSSILPILLSLLLLFTTLTSAADPTSFCKCTCGSQSTIIPLSDPKAATCLDCNRQFCLNYNLPICKDTKEEDVFTTCFQRDSVKDQTVVVIFIIATGGLLVYAAVRPWVGRWLERREAAAYDPLPH